ncbi:MAG TPA: Maf family protein [Bryobacteraceae bacterium]|nr:Maf family protein [Bryobacteraceae bacterium]
MYKSGSLVLASRSPRRAELLAAAGIEFTVRVTDIDETPLAGEAPRDYVLRMAETKARAVEVNNDAGNEEVILAADTTVVLANEIMGKPVDDADATRMLRALAGNRHEVLTAIAVKRAGHIVTDIATTSVWFARLSEAEIAEYVASGEPMDKAGAYGIQGLASKFIDRIEGSYSNVVGLPVAPTYRLLRDC